MRATDRVTTALSQMLARAHPRQARQLVKGFDYYTGQIDAAKDAQPAGIAWGLLAAMDDGIADRLKVEPNAHRIACKPGCSACCHVEVRVSAGEAGFMAHGMEQLGITPDIPRLAAQADAQAWTDVPPEHRACAFLGDNGRCQLYEFRPGACRKYFALDTPDACDTVHAPGAPVAVLAIPDAELIASALISRQESGRMAVMLLKVLGQ